MESFILFRSSNADFFQFRGLGFSLSLQDLATQILYWDKFKAELKQNVPKEMHREKRFVPPLLAEWFAGSMHLINLNELCKTHVFSFPII